MEYFRKSVQARFSKIVLTLGLSKVAVVRGFTPLLKSKIDEEALLLKNKCFH